MEIIVRNKVFRIDLVSNFVVMKYNELMRDYQRVNEIQEKESPKIEKDLNSGLITEEIAEEKMRKILDEVMQLSKEFFPKQLEIVKELLETNDIVYDQKWWERKTAPDDIFSFLHTAYSKDFKDVKKKVALTNG